MSTEERKSYSFQISRRSFLYTLVSSIALGLPRPAGAALVPIKPFSFAFISDVHLTNGKEDTYELLKESQLFLQQAVKLINELNVDFVVFGGDQVSTPGKDDANWNLFLDVVQNLTMPWEFILGEEDISGGRTVDKMKMYGPDWKGKGYETNKPYWAKRYARNVRLIGLDTARPNTKTGFVSKDQLTWLKEELASCVSGVAVVFSHHPLLAPQPYGTGGPPFSDYIVTNGDSAREILGASPYVKLAVSGHVPINKVQTEGPIFYVSCPSLVVYPCAFKVFRVTSDEIYMETYQIEYKALVRKGYKALITSGLAHAYSRSRPAGFIRLCEGESTDKDAVLQLYGGMTIAPYKKARKKKAAQEREEETAGEGEDKSDEGAEVEEETKPAKQAKPKVEEKRKKGETKAEPEETLKKKNEKQEPEAAEKDKKPQEDSGKKQNVGKKFIKFFK
ncbi:MAG: metallophosphoesterase [Cyanobacteria bacterium]|nr:metallophosphoesterase [Cyanobacteriota bacterium]